MFPVCTQGKEHACTQVIFFNPRTTKISTTLEVPEASYDSTGLKHTGTSLELFSAICIETEVLGVKAVSAPAPGEPGNPPGWAALGPG